jgi:arsenic resistance protein ArsH
LPHSPAGRIAVVNSVNTLRVLGRWMRMVTIPNQSSVAKAFDEFDDNGCMKPSKLL